MKNSYQKKLLDERNKCSLKIKNNPKFKAKSPIIKLISENPGNVHKLKARDSTDRWAYYFVYVPPRKEAMFLADLKSNKTINLNKYGPVIGSNYGEKPSKNVLLELKENYGWNFDLE